MAVIPITKTLQDVIPGDTINNTLSFDSIGAGARIEVSIQVITGTILWNLGGDATGGISIVATGYLPNFTIRPGKDEINLKCAGAGDKFRIGILVY